MQFWTRLWSGTPVTAKMLASDLQSIDACNVLPIRIRTFLSKKGNDSEEDLKALQDGLNQKSLLQAVSNPDKFSTKKAVTVWERIFGRKETLDELMQRAAREVDSRLELLSREKPETVEKKFIDLLSNPPPRTPSQKKESFFSNLASYYRDIESKTRAEKLEQSCCSVIFSKDFGDIDKQSSAKQLIQHNPISPNIEKMMKEDILLFARACQDFSEEEKKQLLGQLSKIICDNEAQIKVVCGLLFFLHPSSNMARALYRKDSAMAMSLCSNLQDEGKSKLQKDLLGQAEGKDLEQQMLIVSMERDSSAIGQAANELVELNTPSQQIASSVNNLEEETQKILWDHWNSLIEKADLSQREGLSKYINMAKILSGMKLYRFFSGNWWEQVGERQKVVQQQERLQSNLDKIQKNSTVSDAERKELEVLQAESRKGLIRAKMDLFKQAPSAYATYLFDVLPREDFYKNYQALRKDQKLGLQADLRLAIKEKSGPSVEQDILSLLEEKTEELVSQIEKDLPSAGGDKRANPLALCRKNKDNGVMEALYAKWKGNCTRERMQLLVDLADSASEIVSACKVDQTLFLACLPPAHEPEAALKNGVKNIEHLLQFEFNKTLTEAKVIPEIDRHIHACIEYLRALCLIDGSYSYEKAKYDQFDIPFNLLCRFVGSLSFEEETIQWDQLDFKLQQVLIKVVGQNPEGQDALDAATVLLAFFPSQKNIQTLLDIREFPFIQCCNSLDEGIKNRMINRSQEGDSIGPQAIVFAINPSIENAKSLYEKKCVCFRAIYEQLLPEKKNTLQQELRNSFKEKQTSTKENLEEILQIVPATLSSDDPDYDFWRTTIKALISLDPSVQTTKQLFLYNGDLFLAACKENTKTIVENLHGAITLCSKKNQRMEMLTYLHIMQRVDNNEFLSLVGGDDQASEGFSTAVTTFLINDSNTIEKQVSEDPFPDCKDQNTKVLAAWNLLLEADPTLQTIPSENRNTLVERWIDILQKSPQVKASHIQTVLQLLPTIQNIKKLFASHPLAFSSMQNRQKVIDILRQRIQNNPEVCEDLHMLLKIDPDTCFLSENTRSKLIQAELASLEKDPFPDSIMALTCLNSDSLLSLFSRISKKKQAQWIARMETDKQWPDGPRSVVIEHLKKGLSRNIQKEIDDAMERVKQKQSFPVIDRLYHLVDRENFIHLCSKLKEEELKKILESTEARWRIEPIGKDKDHFKEVVQSIKEAQQLRSLQSK